MSCWLDYLISMDRTATVALNGSDSTYLDGMVMAITATSTWIPLLLVVFGVCYRRVPNWRHLLLVIALFALCVLIADKVSVKVFKHYFMRPRPTWDPQLRDVMDLVNNYRGGHYGFISSHAANTFSVATFFSLVFQKYALTLLFVLWATLCSWSRLYLGVHFVGDVVFGALFGVVVGLLVYWLYGVSRKRFFRTACPAMVSRSADFLTLGGMFFLTLVYVVFYPILTE